MGLGMPITMHTHSLFAKTDWVYIHTHLLFLFEEGVSNHWNGMWNGTVEWNMEWTVYTEQLNHVIVALLSLG